MRKAHKSMRGCVPTNTQQQNECESLGWQSEPSPTGATCHDRWQPNRQQIGRLQRKGIKLAPQLADNERGIRKE